MYSIEKMIVLLKTGLWLSNFMQNVLIFAKVLHAHKSYCNCAQCHQAKITLLSQVILRLPGLKLQEDQAQMF